MNATRRSGGVGQWEHVVRFIRKSWAIFTFVGIIGGVGIFVYCQDQPPEQVLIVRFLVDGKLIQMPLEALESLSSMEDFTKLAIRDQEGVILWEGLLRDLEITIQDTVWAEVKTAP